MCFFHKDDGAQRLLPDLKEQGIEEHSGYCGDDISEDYGISERDRFHYAYQLVEEICRHGDFCIGAACYPEGHVENEHKEDDIKYLKQR